MSKKNPEVTRKPCGCVTTTHASGKRVFAPCPPCGMFKVAEAMQTAAQAMAAVATTLQKQFNEVQKSIALSAAVKKGGK